MSKEDILNKILNGGDRMPAGMAKGADAEALADWLSKKK
jgi:alcohol dehydrogenase (cytochrome c)